MRCKGGGTDLGWCKGVSDKLRKIAEPRKTWQSSHTGKLCLKQITQITKLVSDLTVSGLNLASRKIGRTTVVVGRTIPSMITCGIKFQFKETALSEIVVIIYSSKNFHFIYEKRKIILEIVGNFAKMALNFNLLRIHKIEKFIKEQSLFLEYDFH